MPELITYTVKNMKLKLSQKLYRCFKNVCKVLYVSNRQVVCVGFDV